MIRATRLLALAGSAAGLLVCGVPAAVSQDVKLPPTLSFTAYDTGSSGFNIAVAVGKMLTDKHGADVRVLPAGNDVARLAPVRAGRARPGRWGSAATSPRRVCSSSP